MDGEYLYALWVRANDLENVGVDSWEERDDTDRACWNRLAVMIQSRIATDDWSLPR